MAELIDIDGDDRDRLVEALITRRAEQFGFLKDLIRVDTSATASDRRASCDKICDLIERLGFSVERLAPPSAVNDSGEIVDFENLVIRHTFGDGPTVALACHIDTLEAAEDWLTDPLSGDIGDGVISGLGAVSGKGNLAAFVFALVALMDADVSVGGTVELHISFYGEQGGRNGCAWLLSRGHVVPDTVIAGGPARTVIRHATGVMVLHVDVRGVPAPGFAPHLGIDPMEAMANALTRLFQFRGALETQDSGITGIGSPTLLVEHVEGGRAGGGIAASVGFTVRRTLLPDEDAHAIETQLTKLIGSTVAKSTGVRARIKRTILVPAMTAEDDNPIADVLNAEIEKAYGEAGPELGVAFETEARHYVAAGIPTVIFGAGPLDPAAANMHQAGEALELDLVREGTQTLAVSLARFLSG